jgi:FtsH-binding integral membrane protein
MIVLYSFIMIIAMVVGVANLVNLWVGEQDGLENITNAVSLILCVLIVVYGALNGLFM